MKPQCVVRPQSNDAVILAVKSIMHHSCPFAIKSGSHSLATGKNSIENGMVVDLIYLDHVRVSEDKTVASLGPGARWGDVYSKIEQYGLTVTGGRVSDVGVGGFVLGGK